MPVTRLGRGVALLVVCVVMLAWSPATRAADDPEPISPDRAGAANDTATVGAGVVQVETGFAYGHERIGGSPGEKRFSLEATVRWGITERFEISVESEPFVRVRGPQDDTGHGDLVLSAKYRFLEARDWLPSLALFPVVKLPVAQDPIGSGKTDFGAFLLASFALPGQIDLDVNAGLIAVGQSNPGGHLLQGVVAVGLSRDLSQSLSLFGDIVYASREERGGRDSVLLDLGVVWRPARDVALDVALETVALGTGPDWTVRAGVSFRFGR